ELVEGSTGDCTMKSIRAALLALLASAGPGWAAGPASALVEASTNPSVGLEFMDYVEVGKVFRLNPQDSVVLNYLYSCVRETITGGVVTVGREQSDVQAGKVERGSTPCDAGRMLLTAQLASQSAGTLVRAPNAGNSAPKPQPAAQFTLYGLSPIVELRG